MRSCWQLACRYDSASGLRPASLATNLSPLGCLQAVGKERELIGS